MLIPSAEPQASTSMPIDRAVPSTMRIAASRLAALRSGILVLAISSTWRLDTLPTFSRLGSPEPFSAGNNDKKDMQWSVYGWELKCLHDE